MKQILPKLEEINKHLIFAKTSFTKGSYSHFTAYIDGLITLNKKTVKQISKSALDENHHSAENFEKINFFAKLIFSTIYCLIELSSLMRKLCRRIKVEKFSQKRIFQSSLQLTEF